MMSFVLNIPALNHVLIGLNSLALSEIHPPLLRSPFVVFVADVEKRKALAIAL